MRNRAFLRKTTKKISEKLFEANNSSIPIFWFNLFDFTLIEKIENDLINSYHNDKEEFIGITIKKEIFIANLNFSKIFIEKYYKEKINLYNDFINYLDKTFTENDVLELDILEMANYDGVENLITEIKEIMKNIKKNADNFHSFEPDKSIFSFVGCDVFLKNEFKNYSKDYYEYCQNEEKEQK
jgi:hypothetical protein